MKPNIVWTGGEATLGSKCVVGLERDGIINELTGNYCSHPEDFKPIASSLTAMAELRQKGYQIAIISDQGGIAKGLFTQEDVDKVNDAMMQMLIDAGCITINALYYSASSLKDDIYAKPNTGMFKRCEKEHKTIKFSEGFYVGSTIKDLKAAVNAGARPILVRTGNGLTTEKELEKYAYRELKKRTLVFDTLADFVKTLP